MLVSSYGINRQLVTENGFFYETKIVRTIFNLWQHSLRYIKEFQQALVPHLSMDVKQQGTRRIGCICGMDLATT